MKKFFGIFLPTLFVLAHSAAGHSSEIVHLHPHGENPFLTTWLIAGALGAVLIGLLLLKRFGRG